MVGGRFMKWLSVQYGCPFDAAEDKKLLEMRLFLDLPGISENMVVSMALVVVVFVFGAQNVKTFEIDSILDLFRDVWKSPFDNIISESSKSTHLTDLIFQKGLVFFKTHKTGSSTLTSILWNQLCIKQNKSCFLPPSDHPGKTWDFRKYRDMNTALEGISTSREHTPFEVWLNHVRYNEALFKLIQKPNLLLSITRKPSLRFQSAWYWYEHSKRLNISLSDFIAQTSRQRVQYRQSGNINTRHHFPYRTGLDATSEELTGLSSPSMEDSNYDKKTRAFNASFDRLIANIEQGRMYVLLCDRFDESLIVFSRIMQWSNTDALLYNKKKVRVNSDNDSTSVNSYVENLSIEQLTFLDSLQHYDSTLYKTANSMLDSYIRDYNPSLFKQHLSLFRYKLSVVTEYCSYCSLLSSSGAKCDIPSDMRSAYIDVTGNTVLNNTNYDGTLIRTLHGSMNTTVMIANINNKYATMVNILHPKSTSSHRRSDDVDYPNNNSISSKEEASFSSDLLTYCTALGRDNADNVRHAWDTLRKKGKMNE